ncbi:hypothetical protein BS50DRAFT_608046 [Corynespora cassiicola Philippines]|uniref:Uncharacterized protein n=1 Tax=Corynespora cassiicola Philippines TaxID=1448308 RepID=A0A2T2NZW2_CORCC|nr:hypothetical protein BS50DRAFT_608046 [Corynespora cassiicola Philippines]
MPGPPSSPSPPPPESLGFSFTAGNFDFPHASSSPPPPPAARPRALAPRRQPRRTLPSDHEQRDRDPRHASASLLRRPPPPSSTANRPRATPSERYLRRSQARIREPNTQDMDSTTDILDSLSDIPLPNPFSLAPPVVRRSRSPALDLDSLRRQTKRRKLDHDDARRSEHDGFKYGYKGQVVPGRLRMDIVSCDGGEYEKFNPAGLYKVQNVLKNDKSVYCSESSRCNLLLRHIGETPFTLEKVVIRAPDRGFTAPVQEGLIFVSMSPDDLLSGTAGYQIEYGSPSPRMSPAPSWPGGEPELSFREAVNDPFIWDHSRTGRQELEEQIGRLGLRQPGRRPPLGSPRRRGDQERVDEDDDVYGEPCDYPADESYSAPPGVSAPTPPPFSIAFESEEESEGNEELPSAAVMADRLRRESRWRPESDDDEDDTINRLPPLRRAYALDTYGERRWRSERYLDPIRATRLRNPSRIEPKHVGLDTEGLIAPHARFFIQKHKNKITIKFHPAVSGKYILLKLWSPTHDGNIDIESVQFYGYSGPRFFPAVQPC